MLDGVRCGVGGMIEVVQNGVNFAGKFRMVVRPIDKSRDLAQVMALFPG